MTVEKVKGWIKENNVSIITFIILIFVISSMLFIGIMVDWYNVPKVSEFINVLTKNLMVTEWIAVFSFLVALAVPTIFFVVGESRRKKDKKEAEVQRLLDIEKKNEEFQIIYDQNEKQFICNLITKYKKLEWNDYLINILYGNDSQENFDVKLSMYKLAYLRVQYESMKELFNQLEKEKLLYDISKLTKNNKKNYQHVLQKAFEKNMEEARLVTVVGELITNEEMKKHLSELKLFLYEINNEVTFAFLDCKEGNDLIWPYEKWEEYDL